MENNKSEFKRTGVLHDGAERIEIQISHSGDAARYVSTKQRRYIVLEQVTEWDGTPQENA